MCFFVVLMLILVVIRTNGLLMHVSLMTYIYRMFHCSIRKLVFFSQLFVMDYLSHSS